MSDPLKDDALKFVDNESQDISTRRLVRALLDRLDVERTEAERKKSILDAALDPKLRTLHFEKGQIDAAFEPNLVLLMIADALMKYLDDQNAENYVQINLDSADHGNILLTLHRPNGKSPHELRREAERRADKAEERIAEVERGAVAPAQKRPDAILVHLLESEVLTIVDELREATKEYRRRFDGYPTRLGRPWLLEYDALADRLDQAVAGDRGADQKSVRDDGSSLSGSGEA